MESLNVKICTTCGSEKMKGPIRSEGSLRTGGFFNTIAHAWVCLDCGHIELYVSEFDLAKLRETHAEQEEKQRKKTRDQPYQ